jgi:hypothetical protein
MIGPAYQSAAYLADAERCINFYPEPTESPQPAARWALLPTPGFSVLVTVAQAPIRGIFSENGLTLFVAGYALYEYHATLQTATQRGTVASDDLPVTFSSNGDAGGQIFITSAGVGYLYVPATTTLSTVLASGATMGDYLDGYFLALDATTSTLQLSNLLDGSTWDPTQVAQRTAGSDRWVAMKVCNRLIYLIGEQTSEVWWDSGAFPFPFAPIQEAFMQQGTAAPWSLAQLVVDGAGSLLWLTANAQGRATVVRTNGYTPSRVSTHAIEGSLEGYSTIADAVGGCYQEAGHAFYLLTCPTAAHTWGYDAGTALWHERLSWNPTKAAWTALRAGSFAASPTMNLCGDRNTGSIYQMATAFTTDVDGALIRRLRQPPRIAFGQKRFTVNALQLVLDVGQGLATGQGSTPQVMLQSSRDGGQTFGPERWVSAGPIGAFSTRARWTRLGSARNRVDRFMMSDPVPWRLVDCEIDVTVGTS